MSHLEPPEGRVCEGREGCRVWATYEWLFPSGKVRKLCGTHRRQIEREGVDLRRARSLSDKAPD